MIKSVISNQFVNLALKFRQIWTFQTDDGAGTDLDPAPAAADDKTVPPLRYRGTGDDSKNV